MNLLSLFKYILQKKKGPKNMPYNLTISSQGSTSFQSPKALMEKAIAAIYGLKGRQLIFLTFYLKDFCVRHRSFSILL